MLTSTKRTALPVLAWVVLIHALLFLSFWLTNSLFYSEVNDYLANLLGVSYDFISLCLLIASAVGVWSLARLVVHRLRLRPPLQALTAWLYGVVALIFLVFFYGSFWYLFRQSPVQGPRLAQMLLYFRIILDPIILFAVTCLAALWATRRLSSRKPGSFRAYLSIIAPAAVLCAVLWAIPLVYPPDSVYAGTLPAKPRVIAHRGASMLAPENTLAAMERAAALGVYGVETDLSLSRDGIPFLMHDTTLKRTTNVAAIFPGREKNKAENFSIAEVRELNAGDWFVVTDPYHTIASGAVPAAQVAEYEQQKVPTLAEELQVVRQHRLIFIFDLKELAAPAPTGQSFFDIVFREIHAAGIDSQVWFLVDQNQLKVIRAEAPAMRPAFGADFQQPPGAGELKAQGYEIVNAEYGLSKEWIKKYQAAGLWVNLYTIDEPWQYSRLWLLGVDSTTSSNARALLALNQPLLSLPYSHYLLVWGAVGLLCLGVLVGVTLRSMRG